MLCATVTNLVIAKKLLEEVYDIEEEFNYARFVTIAGAIISFVITAIDTL